jgi:hypothetical protein
MSAHLVLEQILEIQCLLAKSTDDYGMTLSNPSVLKVANTPDSQFLIQAELRAIQKGLKYIEEEPSIVSYKGYVDQDGQYEGVGVQIFDDGLKFYGEWHLNKLHGVGKEVYDDGDIWWGE